MKTDNKNTDTKKELHSIIDSLSDEQASVLLIELAAQYGTASSRSKAGKQVDAGKALQELDSIKRSKVKRGFTNDPDGYFHKLFELMYKYVPSLTEAGKYSEANEIISKVYIMTDVWFNDDLYEDDRGTVVEECLEYWTSIAGKCDKPFKQGLKDSLSKLVSQGRECDCADDDLSELIEKAFADIS